MNTRYLALLCITAAAAAAPAAAQSNYVIGGIGRSSIDADANAIDNVANGNGLAPSSTSTTSKHTAWKLQLGHRINNAWAVEGGYVDLGSAKYTNTNAAYTASGEKKANAINLDLVWMYPFNPTWTLLGRLGGYRWETKSDLPAAGGMVGRTDNGYDFKLGLGLQYDFNNRFGVRGAYDRFNGVGRSTTTGDSRVNLLTVDAVLKF